MLPAAPPHTEDEFRQVLSMERPHASLFTYYILTSLMLGPFFPLLLVPLYFRYQTMRYRFDAQGVNMRWGILFRREVSLTYARIQDIHLTSNVVERWLGLAQVKLSTASGSASAEMVIEGLPEFELVRDFLYTKMRGAHEKHEAPLGAEGPAVDSLPEVVMALRRVSDDLRAVRVALERSPDTHE